MLGDEHSFELTAEDDDFHRPPGPDATWVDNTFFGFTIPERDLTTYIYVVARPTLGVALVDLRVWDARGYSPWDAPFRWHDAYIPLRPDADLRKLEFPNGLRIDCLETGRRYRLRFDHRDCAFDVEFVGTMAPKCSGSKPDVLGTFTSAHVDGPGVITGTMRLRDETFAINCTYMRDRSWGPREEQPDLHLGYTHGQGPNHAFQLFWAPDDDGVALSGYLYRDGVVAALTEGRREPTDPMDWPLDVTVRGTDALGREFVAKGRTTKRVAQNVPGWLLCWCRTARWEMDGAEIWGEDQEYWSVDGYRGLLRSRD